MDEFVNETVFSELGKTSVINNWKFVGWQLRVNDVAIDTLCFHHGNYGLREVFYQMNYGSKRREKGYL